MNGKASGRHSPPLISASEPGIFSGKSLAHSATTQGERGAEADVVHVQTSDWSSADQTRGRHLSIRLGAVCKWAVLEKRRHRRVHLTFYFNPSSRLAPSGFGGALLTSTTLTYLSAAMFVILLNFK